MNLNLAVQVVVGHLCSFYVILTKIRFLQPVTESEHLQPGEFLSRNPLNGLVAQVWHASWYIDNRSLFITSAVQIITSKALDIKRYKST